MDFMVIRPTIHVIRPMPTRRLVPQSEVMSVLRSSAGAIRVLVVDDDPRVRAAIAQTIALEDDLTLVAEAAGAVAALASSAQTDPAVALVDLLLPDRATGLTLVRNLCRRPGYAVVAMSVRSGLRQAALDAGAMEFVEKDGDVEAILRAVRRAANSLSGPRRGS